MEKIVPQWKPQSKRKKMGDSHRILKIKSYRKNKTKSLTVRLSVELWNLSSVAILEAYKSGNGIKTDCYIYKRNTIGLFLKWFSTTRTAASTARISIFTPSLVKLRAYFKMVPNVSVPISQRWKKTTNGFYHCKIYPWESLILEHGRNQTKLKY